MLLISTIAIFIKDSILQQWFISNWLKWSSLLCKINIKISKKWKKGSFFRKIIIIEKTLTFKYLDGTCYEKDSISITLEYQCNFCLKFERFCNYLLVGCNYLGKSFKYLYKLNIFSESKRKHFDNHHWQQL